MRCALCLLLLVFPLLVACSGGPTVAADDRPRAIEPVPANVELARRLRLLVPIEAGRYTLDGIAGLIDHEAGAAVRFDWDGLAEVGITPATEVEVLDGAPPAERLLAMTLFEAAPDAGEVYPTYLLIDGTAVVGTNRSLVRLAPQVRWPEGGPRVVDASTYTKRLLDDTIMQAHFGGAPLLEVISSIEQEAGLEIDVDWGTLQQHGISRQTTIAIELNVVSASQLLELALKQASANNFDDEKAGYEVLDGVVHITALYQFTWYTEIRLYDVRDLVDRMYGPVLETVYADDPFALAMLKRYDLAWCISFADLPPMFDPTFPEIVDEAQDQLAERSRLTEMLVELIQDTVGDPDEWLDEYSTIIEVNGNLIIRTPERNHREIESLLERLREGHRGTIRRFMREVEAARLLREAEGLRAVGDLRGALAAAERAHAVDPGNEPARALRDVLEATIERE